MTNTEITKKGIHSQVAAGTNLIRQAMGPGFKNLLEKASLRDAPSTTP